MKGFFLAAALAFAAATSPSVIAQTLSSEQKLDIIARDLPRVIEAITRFNRELEPYVKASLALNEILAGRAPDEAIAAARRHLMRAPKDFDHARNRHAALDTDKLRRSGLANVIESIENAFRKMPDIGEAVRDHVWKQLDAAERGDRRKLARIAARTGKFNVVLAENQVLIHRAALQIVPQSSPQFDVNSAYLIIALSMRAMLEMSASSSRNFGAYAELTAKTAKDVRVHIDRAEAKLARVLMALDQPDIDVKYLNGRPLKDVLTTVQAMLEAAFDVERGFADAFEDVSGAFRRFARNPRDKAVLADLLAFDRRIVDLSERREATSADYAELLEIFRSKEF